MQSSGFETLAKITALMFAAVGIPMVILIVSSLMQNGGISEFDHPSDAPAHARAKGIFLEELVILFPDTIKAIANDSQEYDFLPTEAWLEKLPYWKSDTRKPDSLAFRSDWILMVINFKVFRNNIPLTLDHGTGGLITLNDGYYRIGSISIPDGTSGQMSIELNSDQMVFDT